MTDITSIGAPDHPQSRLHRLILQTLCNMDDGRSENDLSGSVSLRQVPAEKY
jgi:hypothetical protein